MRTRTVIAGLLALTMAMAGCATTTSGQPRTAPSTVTVTAAPATTAPATTTATSKSSTRPTKATANGVRADVIVGSTKQKSGLHVALTFDDGPDPTWTPQVLDLLAQYHVKAVFCLVGVNAKAHPALVRRIVAEGHELCDHTMHHKENLPTLPPDARRAEIADAQQAILAAVPDAEVPYFRAPAGAFSKTDDPDSVQQIAADLGMQPLAWSVDTVDWTKPGTDAIVASVERVSGHDVVLLHDAGGDRSQTVAALKVVLPWLVAHGYEFDFPAL
jgi:peptidoglycan/xylan/chitin deacetylase (PgdA/CDA1 family)